MVNKQRINYKKILQINLADTTAQLKIVGDMYEYIGGVLTSLRLLEEYYDDNPVVISTGLLSGIYPYLSKASLVYIQGDIIKEKIGGGSIATKMNFAGIDAIVITGHSSKFLLITCNDDGVSISNLDYEKFISLKSDLYISNKFVNSLDYFTFGNDIQLENFMDGGIKIEIEMSEDVEIQNAYDFKNIYKEILNSYKLLTVEPRNNPSCFGCPMGCDFSGEGEDDLNVSILPRCLISCGYAAEIYKDIPLVYRCFDAVGYQIKHAQLENIPSVYAQTKERIKIIENTI